MSDPGDQENDEQSSCRNCGRTAGPAFCGHCGQAVEERRAPFLELTRELASDWISLDSRLFRTLKALIVPGRLTQLHQVGKRAPYLRPFRLYLLASLALFSTLLTLQTPDSSEYDILVAGELVDSASEGSSINRSINMLDPKSAINRWVIARYPDEVARFSRLPTEQQLDALFTSLRRILPLALIFFVPFLAIALKLIYWRSGALYVDHLVFSLHLQSALFLGMTLVWAITWALRLSVVVNFLLYGLAGFLLLTVYFGRALGRLHQQGRWRTIAKTFLLLFIYANLMGAIIGVIPLATVLRTP